MQLSCDADGVMRRYLVDFDLRGIKWIETDVLVIGTGVAGLRAALTAAETCKVVVVAKERAIDSNTWRAQGGIACAINDGDSTESHIADTLSSGKGLCDGNIVRTVVGEGPGAVSEVIAWGGKFDLSESGGLEFAQEGGHSAKRIIHAGGDATGEEIEKILEKKVRASENISIIEHFYVIDLYTENGKCLGAIGYSHVYGTTRIACPATILATGGAARIFRESTNAPVATGDGIAMAYRAGCTIDDMEFVQFHPTTLYIAGAERALITEAARGEGGILRNGYGRRFMFDYHPKGELAPRDIVSQAIVSEMRKTRETSAYLDMTHADAEKVCSRFPRLCALCKSFGIDPAKDRIPVRPSAHYTIGGVGIDAAGRTSVQGLFAAGEVAASRFHGANRLGSNSLLEGIVFGRLVGRVAADAVSGETITYNKDAIFGNGETVGHEYIDVNDVINAMRSLIWRKAGIERTEDGLKEAIVKIGFWQKYVLPAKFNFPFAWTLQNMLVVGEMIARAALERRESRGVHTRLDYAGTDDKFLKHTRFSKR